MYDHLRRRYRRLRDQDMPRLKKSFINQFDAQALGQFIKSVRQSQGRNLSDVAREADVNRKAAHNLERGTGVPSIRTIEAICRQIDLDPLAAIGAGFGEVPGDAAGKTHVLQEELSGLSADDLAFVIDFVKLLRSRLKAGGKERDRPGRFGSRSA